MRQLQCYHGHKLENLENMNQSGPVQNFQFKVKRINRTTSQLFLNWDLTDDPRKYDVKLRT